MPADQPAPFCPDHTPQRWLRPRQVDIRHIDLAITVDLEARRIDGAVVHHCQPLPGGPRLGTLELDQQDLLIVAVEVDGQPARFATRPGKVDIALPDGWSGLGTVRIAFTAEQPPAGMFFIAPRAAGRPHQIGAQAAMCWTQGAMEEHSCWFPCFDSPNQLSTFRVAIRHRSHLAAVANGERDGAVVHGDGWTTTTWHLDRPQVLYLLNVAVGAFAAVDDATGSVPITHWLPEGRADCAAAMFRATAFAIDWLGRATGLPFAWPRYGHVVVHGFMWGGMENSTLTTITDRVLMDAAVQEREDVDCDALVIHELVHQWYGDLMTMKGWSDLWLNESFATWLEARGTAAWKAHHAGAVEQDELDLALWRNRAAYLEEDGGRYRRALVTNRWVDAYELFDRVAYEKGSLILHHLRHVLGAERFDAGLALYTRRHAHDLVETADLRQALEDATGEALDWFVDQWLYRPGHPALKVRWRHDPGARVLLVSVEQTQGADDADKRWRIPTALAWRGTDGALVRQDIVLGKATDTFVIPCAEAPRWLAVDPDGHVPAVWDEDGDTGQLLARLGDAQLGAQARARAAQVAGCKHPTPALVAGCAALLDDGGTPELVKQELIAALGAWRHPAARAVLCASWGGLREPRLRRLVAKALGGFRGDTMVAAWLESAVATEPAALTRAELLAARGALEVPGATAFLCRHLDTPSWNQRLRQGCVRGLGACAEPAAIEVVLPLIVDLEEVEGVRTAACAAAGELGRRQLAARERIRHGLERTLDDEALFVRSAAAKALATLGDPQASAALAACHGRERFGNVRRVLREAQETLRQAAAVLTATAELTRRCDEQERERKRLETRIEALEQRLDAMKPA